MSDAKPFKTNATDYDVEALPPQFVGEIVDGDLYASPRSAGLHAGAAANLLGTLVGPYWHARNGPGGWIILGEPELGLVGQTLVPDLAAWRRERMPKLLDARRFELPPDWLCEILSPSTAALDRSLKMRTYAAGGVGHVWLIDPPLQTVEVYRLDGATYRLIETLTGATLARPEPFVERELELALLWST